jgi:hypothetical protein
MFTFIKYLALVLTVTFLPWTSSDTAAVPARSAGSRVYSEALFLSPLPSSLAQAEYESVWLYWEWRVPHTGSYRLVSRSGKNTASVA